MKYLLPTMAAVTAAWCPAASARNVDYQDFTNPAVPVRGEASSRPPRATASLHAPFQQSAQLDAAFIALADDDPATREMRGIRNTPLPCYSRAYHPIRSLTTSAERRRAVWYLAMTQAACDAGVPPSLLDALIIQESGYNPMALSPKGASGISQLMPSRARLLGVRDVWNPVENMRGGARHLRTLLDEFGRFDLALAAYNAGEGRVRSTRQIPQLRETVNYVTRILLTMQSSLMTAPTP